MKQLLYIYSLFLPLNALSFELGQNVHCYGYLTQKGKKISYILEGKVLYIPENLNLVVYGHSPAFNSKKLHKISKDSCVDSAHYSTNTPILKEIAQEEETVEIKESEAKNKSEVSKEEQIVKEESKKKYENFFQATNTRSQPTKHNETDFIDESSLETNKFKKPESKVDKISYNINKPDKKKINDEKTNETNKANGFKILSYWDYLKFLKERLFK